MVKCEIIITKLTIEGKICDVYGLEFYRNDEKVPFKIIKNICSDYDMIDALKELFNNNDVYENHIDDIIYDMLL